MNLTKGRLFISFTLILAFSALILFRLFYIQLWEAKRFKFLVQKQVEESKTVTQAKGLIMDRNYRIIAMNTRAVSIAACPKKIKNKKRFAAVLSSKIGISPEEIECKLEKNTNFVWLKRKMPFKNIQDIDKLDIKGLVVKEETKRYYHYGEMTSHVIGVAGMDGNGLSGIEYMYDNLIGNKQVAEKYMKDGLKRKLGVVSGNSFGSANIVLTIDTTLQYIAARELKELAKIYTPKKAFIIIQNPNNGEILALSCWPGIEPDSLDFTPKDLLNPAIHDIFEPGSTAKLVTAAAAVSEGKYNADDIVYCENGKFKYYDIEINDHEKYGYLTFGGVFAYSSNIGFAKVGMKVGREEMYSWIKKFGFGSYTGVDLPGEQEGIVIRPYSRKWSMVTLPSISFGQGIGVTGLQLINAYSAVANGGVLYEPYIIKSFVDDNNKVIWEQKPRVIREVVSREVAEKLKIMLRGVVEYGTGKLAAVRGYEVCGKTGTAQKVDPVTKKYSMHEYISSFCGFLPAENPQISILIVLDSPMTDYWASNVACPAFSTVAESAMNYLNIPRKEIFFYDFTKAISREY